MREFVCDCVSENVSVCENMCEFVKVFACDCLKVCECV